MDLAIVIVNWNSAEYTLDCIASIYETPFGRACEVVVVDNASFDGVGARLAEQFPDVTFVQGDRNIGFGLANNAGYDRTSAGIVLFLNPDTRVKPDALETMHRYVVEHETVGAVGCRLLNADGSVQRTSIQPFPTILNQAIDSEFLQRLLPRSRLWGQSPLYGSSDGVAVDSVSGAAVMVRRKAFEEAGRFSSRYFMYAEDVDLCHSVWQAGYQVHYLGSVSIVHFGSGATAGEGGGYFSSLMMRQSTFAFLRHARGPMYALGYRLAMILSALVRLMLLSPLAAVRGRGSRARFGVGKWARILGWGAGIVRVEGAGR